MATAAVMKYVRLSPQKGRLVANEIRGKQVEEAINLLTFSKKKAAALIKKVVDSAIANAEHNDGADIDLLYIKKICVDQAPTFERSRARAKGRGTRILKRNCHITVEVEERDED